MLVQALFEIFVIQTTDMHICNNNNNNNLYFQRVTHLAEIQANLP